MGCRELIDCFGPALMKESDVSDEEVETIESDEERLARGAKEGCREARNDLFLRYRDLIQRLAAPSRRLLLRTVTYRRLANPAIELEDIDQQAFLVFCDVLDEWNPDAERFDERLARRMPGLLLHYVRDTLRYSSRERGGIEENEPAIAEDGELRGALPPYALALPAYLQEAVKLRYIDGLPSASIARLVRRNRRTVHRNLKTALALMRDSLEETWEAV
jgi:RNA polymerase sigma factor (sigma-70 family)